MISILRSDNDLLRQAEQNLKNQNSLNLLLERQKREYSRRQVVVSAPKILSMAPAQNLFI